jgi:hypothetical protein
MQALKFTPPTTSAVNQAANIFYGDLVAKLMLILQLAQWSIHLS